MYPILLNVGGLTLYSYGVMAVVAMVSAGFVVRRLLRRLGLEPPVALELTIAAIIGGLAGARAYWVVEHWSEVRGDLLHGLMGGAGFTWYGGLVGGVVAVIVLARFRRLPLGIVANAMAPAVALGYAIARIGCLLAGDGTYGRPSDLPWAIAFPQGMMPTTVRVQPTGAVRDAGHARGLRRPVPCGAPAAAWLVRLRLVPRAVGRGEVRGRVPSHQHAMAAGPDAAAVVRARKRARGRDGSGSDAASAAAHRRCCVK